MRSRSHPIFSRFKTSWKQESLRKTGNILEMVSMFVAPELGILLTATGGVMNVVSTHNRQKSGLLRRNQSTRSYIADVGTAALMEVGLVYTAKIGIEARAAKAAKEAREARIEQVNHAFADRSMDRFQAQETFDNRPQMDLQQMNLAKYDNDVLTPEKEAEVQAWWESVRGQMDDTRIGGEAQTTNRNAFETVSVERKGYYTISLQKSEIDMIRLDWADTQAETFESQTDLEELQQGLRSGKKSIEDYTLSPALRKFANIADNDSAEIMTQKIKDLSVDQQEFFRYKIGIWKKSTEYIREQEILSAYGIALKMAQ